MEKYSTGLRNHIMSGGSVRGAMKGGRLLIYSGSQPTDADSAVQGTMLCEINAGGTWDDELQSAGSIELLTGAAGSVDTITVATVDILGGAVNYVTSLAATAALVVTQINKYNPLGIKAVSDGDATPKITLYAPIGVSPVTWAVSSTCTTITKTDTAFDSEVAGDAGAYGLDFGLAASGAISKSGTWSGTVTTGGQAGWFRLVGPLVDAGSSSTTLSRIDGTITSTGGGGDLTLTSTTLALNAPITIDSFTLTQEATGR